MVQQDGVNSAKSVVIIAQIFPISRQESSIQETIDTVEPVLSARRCLGADEAASLSRKLSAKKLSVACCEPTWQHLQIVSEAWQKCGC